MKTILKSQLMLLLIVPFIAFAQQQKLQDQQQKQPLLNSYDSDGDGIPDSTDQCVLLKGSKDFKGCPYKKKVTTLDRDGDGLKDANDNCPDIFGLEINKGCPEMQKPTNTQDKSSIEENNSLFTTTSSFSTEESETFKATLLHIMSGTFVPSGAPKEEAGVASNTEGGIPTASCLPGANKCYLKDNAKTFYADFGRYSSEVAAAAKYYALRQKLYESLGSAEWEGAETTTGGYISTFQLTRKDKQAGSPVVTTHVDRMGDNYQVYVTVDRK